MRFKDMSRAFYREGDEKMIALSFVMEDGSTKLMDVPCGVAGGMAIWLFSAVKELEEKDIDELPSIDPSDEYRIVGC